MKARLWAGFAVAAIAVAFAGCTTQSTGGGSGAVDSNDQDPACHRAALAVASADPDFEWNGSGMDAYHENYDDCIAANDEFGS